MTSDYKEIALIGTDDRETGDILSRLMQHNIGVRFFTDTPEKVMVGDDSNVIVSGMDFYKHTLMEESLSGYHDAILVYNDDLSDAATNDLALKTFADTVHAARQAGVKRLIVVASPEATQYYTSTLRRLDDLDWVYISTEGDYADHAVGEIVAPSRHKEIYEE